MSLPDGLAQTRRGRSSGAKVVITGLVLAIPVPLAMLAGVIIVSVTQPDGTFTGAPAVVLACLLFGLAVSFVLGAVVTLVGTVIVLGSRPRANAEARSVLRQRRDIAATSTQAVAVQRTIVPGRGWRRGLPFTLGGVPLLLAVLAAAVEAEGVAWWCVVAALPGVGWSLARYAVRWRGTRALLAAQGLTVAGDYDDKAALQRRAAAMADFATVRGLSYQPEAPLRAWASGIARNQLSGTLDGISFSCSDRFMTQTTQTTNDQPEKLRITSAETSLAIPFPTVIALAVAPDSADATLRWSYLGTQVQLESGEFNKAFNVYCDDHMRARLVLNPAVMHDLLSWPSPIQLVLADGELRLTAVATLIATEQLDAFVALAARIQRLARAALVARA